MSKNELEDQLLEQINKDANLLEGLSLKILKLLMRPKMKRLLKKLEKDPKFKAAIADAEYQNQKLMKQLRGFADDEGNIPDKFKRLIPTWL